MSLHSNKKKKGLPNKIRNSKGNLVSDNQSVLNMWKNYYRNLLNPADKSDAPSQDCNESPVDLSCTTPAVNDLENSFLNDPITQDEILSALSNRNSHSALGPDGISISFLKNDLCIEFMHSTFNTCLQHGKVPGQWIRSIIQPIPRSNGSSLEPRDYRGISIQSSVMKILCSIINIHLSNYLECNQLLVEEQNGFCKGRCCQDHIFTLNTILEGKKSIGKCTYFCL